MLAVDLVFGLLIPNKTFANCIQRFLGEPELVPANTAEQEREWWARERSTCFAVQPQGRASLLAAG